MIDNKLKVGDIIVITYRETKNYLQIGKVIDIRPYKNPDNILEKSPMMNTISIASDMNGENQPLKSSLQT